TYALFQQHAAILARANSPKKPKAPREAIDAAPSPFQFPVSAFQFPLQSTEIGPFRVDNRIIGVPEPYSIRRCSSSQVRRVSEQMLAWQLIGACSLDSTKNAD